MFTEFQSISNYQAYKKVFSDRMMLPHPTDSRRLLGNTQREDFLPFLQPLIRRLPTNANIFDVGAGAGEIVDLALYEATSAAISIEEPNPLLIKSYQERVKKYPNLHLALVHEGSMQDLYRYIKSSHNPSARVAPAKESQDLVLALQMIYHVTPFEENGIDPDTEIIDAVSFLYETMRPGSSLFLVYSDDDTATTGLASEWYFEKTRQLSKLANLKKIKRARNRILKSGLIAEFLAAKFPQSKPRLTCERTSSWIFGRTLEDMAILCLLGDDELSNDQEFDVRKLEIYLDFVKNNAERIQLGIEQRPIAQQGMYRFFQGQLVLTIEKT
jgi:hypothetical protein